MGWAVIDLGLSPAARRALVQTLSQSHLVGVRVQILDLEHTPLGLVSSRVVDGQVNVDGSAEVSRQLQLTLVDPSRNVVVDTDDGAPRLDRMVRVYYTVWVDGGGLDCWVQIPVFTGPVTSTRREEGLLTLEATGKEHLARTPGWKARTFAQGLNRVLVIRAIMKELAGEDRFSFPESWKAKTARTISLSKNATPWHHARELAKSMNAQLFYDGRGVLRLRKYPVRSSFTFRDGNSGTLMSQPSVTESSSEIVNTVRVVGATPKKKKTPVEATAYLPPYHRYAPGKMGRNGKPRYLPETIEDDTLRSEAEARRTAQRRIRQIQVDAQDVEFTALPFPLLEEGDVVTIDSRDVKLTTRIMKFSIPLGGKEVGTYGYIAPVSKRRRRVIARRMKEHRR